MRPFRFLAHPGGSHSGKQLGEVARRAEGLGYSGLVFPDHLGMQMSPIPAMATVLAATESLRAAPFVLNVDLHQPAVLAQDLASLDVLSGGRVDIAIGAGWNKPEYDATGLSFDPTGTRVERLTEAVAILKGCFGDGAYSLAGDHYTITDFNSQPKPVQRPHPPFFIGGGGRRTLELAARQANVVGFAPRLLKGAADPRSMTFEATVEKMEWVRTAAGDRFEELEFNAYPSGVPVTVTDDLHGEAGKVVDFFRKQSGHELTVEEVIDSPHLFIGSIDRLTEKFVELRERLGISSFMVGDVDELAPVVERLAGT
ncbi:MAG TPA: TIGR03621 family F420-dependent LLM class oxidoreductase [Acidimicrobiales bacterium]|nr:TIGR03621 family F420-dependent LLM class oxidoreductase [Acidimicrobiales bacterium]